MKYRIVPLTSLLIVSLLSSTTVLADPNDHGRERAYNPPRNSAPPPRHAAPPPQRHAAPPPQRHAAPPPRRQAAPPPQYRAAPPPRVTYRKMAPLPRGSYATYQQRPGRSWRMGRSLPRTVVYQEIPSPQIYNLAPPPRNHRYVRVGNDILLLAIGTGLIVNALYDIGY